MIKISKKSNKLNNIVNFIFKHKILTFLIIILLFSLPLIIVHFLFKWHSNISFIQSEWTAGDIISYIAGFEAFLGTTILSFLALWQNQQHKTENDTKDKKIIEIENEKIRLSNMPQFIIQTCDYTKAIDHNIQLSDKLQNEDYVPLLYTPTHGFFITENMIGWASANKQLAVEKNKLSNFISLINCGNNTAHQVKLTMKIGNDKKIYIDEKVTSVKKDNEIFLYLSLNSHSKINSDLFLQLSFYDCFQNIYEQDFHITNTSEAILVKSYSDIKLTKKSNCMNLQLQD